MKFLLLPCFLLSMSVLAQGGLPSVPYIYVEGKAEIEKPADMVTLRFDLVARNPEQPKANEEVQAKATKILALLDEKKIAKGDVIAADVKSEPEFEGDDSSSKKGKLIGYKVSRRFQAKLRDLVAFPKIVDELIGITGVEITDVDPGLTKEKEMQEEIWGKALVNAREQADKTVKGMGVKIESLFAISPTPFPRIRAEMFRSEYGEATTERVVVTGPPEYRLGSMTVSQSVHVIYLISPAK